MKRNVQISVTAPRASRESSLRTITLRATMAFVPPARVMVRTTCEEEPRKGSVRRVHPKRWEGERGAYDEGGGNHGKSDGDSVKDDLLVSVERVGGEAEKGEDAADSEDWMDEVMVSIDERKGKESGRERTANGEPGESALKRRSDRDSEKLADDVARRERPRLGVAVPRSMTVVVSADLKEEGESDLGRRKETRERRKCAPCGPCCLHP